MPAMRYRLGGRERRDFQIEQASGLVLATTIARGGVDMGFSGVRAVMMVVALVVLVVAVTKFDLPGWIIPVGLIVAGVVVRAKEKRA
jgi:hypothetical protein